MFENNQSNIIDNKIIETVNNIEDWDEISDDVINVCSQIFELTNKVLQAHMKFGFTAIEANINPSIKEVLMSMRMVEKMLEALEISGLLEFSETRVIQNAQQMIWCVKGVAIALENGSVEDYHTCVDLIRKQAHH